MLYIVEEYHISTRYCWSICWICIINKVITLKSDLHFHTHIKEKEDWSSLVTSLIFPVDIGIV